MGMPVISHVGFIWFRFKKEMKKNRKIKKNKTKKLIRNDDEQIENNENKNKIKKNKTKI